MKKDPDPIMNIRIPAEMKAQLFEIADREDLTPSQIVRKLVKNWLEEANVKTNSSNVVGG